MKKNNLLVLCVITSIIAILAPIITLHLLEDKNINYLNSVSLSFMKEGNRNFGNTMINTIYAKYNGTKYNVGTSDEYDYSIPDKVIDGEHHINDSLMSLQELESIGLIKSDFFNFIASNERVITRTNEYHGENLNYSKKRLFLSKDDFKVAFMSFEIENITNKIIALKIPKEYIVNKKETLENYINYLNINSEDWIYENNSITSNNKRLEIKIENINDFISISIVPYM